MSVSAHRKIVTVLFCDVVGSTALGESADPEALQALLGRYFERMKAIVERHGGTVEKFIGDAVMAVFGVPVSHEDDASRAVRAAAEMREALPELGVEARIGVNTGEVVTGTEERLVTGDAVNVAARLEQAAQPGEVLIGEATHALVRGAVEVESVDPLELRGKAKPVPALRLLSVLEPSERSHASRFAGRGPELAAIAAAWERANAQSRCELFTVVGDAGVGKSRLVAEALTAFADRVVRGRCLPYGKGITYWPVVEVVKQIAAFPSDPAAAAAIRSLLGESDVSTSSDEIAWAFRKLLEEQAPLVVVFDDIQWGEETFLGLVESTVLLSTGVPLLLLCMARPELVEQRPTWPVTLRLEPLPPEHADALIGDAVSGELRERIAHAAGGNPLFISEILAMATGNGEVEVPPTLKALLAARLDQLDEPGRRVLEGGAVAGEIFHRGAVQALAPEEIQVTTRLAGLVRRELIRPDRAQLPGDDGYRFRHLLIRDAAYDALPKAVRADLHARFAAWLDEHGHALVERDEIVGYHLEQAGRYRAELGQPDGALADRAAARLAAAGNRAIDRRDPRAAAALLGRAAELVRPHRTDVALELEFAWVCADFDPRRLAPLWEMVALVAAMHHQHDAAAAAFLEALRYQRLAGYSRSDMYLEWSLLIGPRSADDAIRMMDEVAEWRSPGSQDGARAVLLAMLGRFDEAWPLAEARSSHLHEVTGDISRDAYEDLALIATIEGDRERACRYVAEAIKPIAHVAIPAALAKSRLARDLCYLGRFDEAERLLEEAQAVLPPGSGVRVMADAAEALLLAHRGELQHAEALARTAVATAETKTDNVWWQALTHEDLATVLERAGRIDEAREALERSLALWERKGCLPRARRVRGQIASLGRAH